MEKGIEVGSWGIGDVDCILLYMIYFGDELGIWGLLGLVSWVEYTDTLGYVGGSEVRKPSLVH